MAGSRNGSGKIQLPESLVNEVSNYKLHPVLLDASLQVLGAALSGQDQLGAYLPVGLEKYQVYGSVPLHLWSQVKLNQDYSQPSQTITADVDLFDDSGLLVAQIQGLSVKRVSSQILGRFLQKEEAENWLYEIVWRPQNRDLNLPLTGAENLGTWLLLTTGDGIGSSLANQLTQLGEYCIMVSVGSHYQKLTSQSYTVNPLVADDFTKLFQESLENKPPLKGIVHLWSCESHSSTDLSLEALQQAQVIGCGGVLSLVQALLQKQGSKLPRLWLVTQDTQSLDSSAKSLELQHAPLWGLGRAIALEHPELQCVCVDLEASENQIQSPLLAEILAPDSENQVIYRQGIRHVARLVQHSTKTSSTSKLEKIRSDSSYLITGGLGALGLKVADWMVSQGAKYLVLTGRSEPTAETQAVIEQLQQTGTQVLVLKADVSKQEDVIKLLNEIKSSLPLWVVLFMLQVF